MESSSDSDSDAPALQTTSLPQLETPKRKASAWGGVLDAEDEVFKPQVYSPSIGKLNQTHFV